MSRDELLRRVRAGKVAGHLLAVDAAIDFALSHGAHAAAVSLRDALNYFASPLPYEETVEGDVVDG